eukprot:752402-Hanusia_phi.AAC.1
MGMGPRKDGASSGRQRHGECAAGDGARRRLVWLRGRPGAKRGRKRRRRGIVIVFRSAKVSGKFKIVYVDVNVLRDAIVDLHSKSFAGMSEPSSSSSL